MAALIDGIILQPNLYKSPKAPYISGEPHAFRYKGPEDINDPHSKIVARALSTWLDNPSTTKMMVDEANQIAQNLNALRNIKAPLKRLKAKKNGLRSHAELFIEDYSYRKPSSVHKKKFKQGITSIRSFCIEMNDVAPYNLKYIDLYNWWWGKNNYSSPEYWKSGNTHRNRQSVHKQFFDYLIREKLINRDEFLGNPFNNTSYGECPLGLRELEEKKTTRITLIQLYDIHRCAKENEAFHVCNAIDLAYATGMRLSDVANLRFDENIINNSLRTHFGKTGELDKDGTIHIQMRFDKHPRIEEIVKQCERTRLSVSRDGKSSPYLIHRRFRNNGCHGKRHYSQVLPDHLGKQFTKYRLISVEQNNNNIWPPIETGSLRPGFHQIRSLFAKTLQENGIEISATQVSLGHADISMTKHYQAGYETDYVDMPVSVTQEMIENKLHKERASL